MNQLQAVALNEGLRCKKRLWRDAGREQLESFRLAPWASRRRCDLLELLDRLNPTIAELSQAIEQEVEKCPEARDALESSLKLAPSQMSARLLLGHVYLQLKDAKNAEDQFEAALLVDPNNSEGRLGLAEAQIQQSDFAAALTDLEAFTKTDPRNAAALRLLARVYRGLGRGQDAKRTEQQAGALEKR
jgi:Tfp pilus assembly protein PilF